MSASDDSSHDPPPPAAERFEPEGPASGAAAAPTRASLATLVAESAARLKQISAQGRFAKRLERLEVAARTLGAERRLGPRMPHNAPAEMRIDGEPHATSTIDIGPRGMMLERPKTLDGVTDIRCQIALDQIGRLEAQLVALDRETLCLTLDDDRPSDAAARLSLLLADLARQNANAIAAATGFAGAIGRAFTLAIEEQRIKVGDLFSSDLRPIPGTNPAQFDHPAGAFFGDVLPPILARYYQPEHNIAYAVATDRNGYVPVHQPAFSQAQRSTDLLFNHKFARNKRIYDDRWTWRATRFAPAPIVQACRRDMPRGFGALVCEASAPLFIANKRWGAAQIGFSLDLEA